MKCEYKLIYENDDKLLDFIKLAYENNNLTNTENYLNIEEKDLSHLSNINNIIVHLYNDEHIIGFLKCITVTVNGNFCLKPISIHYTLNEYKYNFSI